ncbi:MAG: alpha/beta fold hydrolase [Roseovarius sp.]
MIYRFDACLLDTDKRRLLRDGEPVHVEPQVFELLAALAEADGAVVSKEALIERVWRGLNVSDATISARINAARAAVGDDGKRQRVIRTVPRVGFRLDVPVLGAAADAPAPAPVAPAPARDDPPPPPIRYLRTRDGEMIAHAHHGAGPPLVRVSHWLSHLELDWECPVWSPLLARMGRNFTLYRYDQRGTGLSTREMARLDLDTFVDDLCCVFDANGLESAAIFASSQASPVALRFAARNPGRVRAIVLQGGYALGRALRPPAPGQIDEDTVLGLIRAGWGQEDGAFMKAFSALFAPDATPEQLASLVHIQNMSISAENAARLRRAIDRFSVEDDLAQVTAPVLVTHARDDAIHPFSQGQFLASRLPNAELLPLASRNHFLLPQLPCWAQVMEAVERFCLPR